MNSHNEVPFFWFRLAEIVSSAPIVVNRRSDLGKSDNFYLKTLAYTKNSKSKIYLYGITHSCCFVASFRRSKNKPEDILNIVWLTVPLFLKLMNFFYFDHFSIACNHWSKVSLVVFAYTYLFYSFTSQMASDFAFRISKLQLKLWIFNRSSINSLGKSIAFASI